MVLNLDHLDLELVSACPGATGSGYPTVFTVYEYLTFHHCILTCQVWARGFVLRFRVCIP